MTDIDSVLQTQTYHIFYKNKLLKQLSAQTPLKLKATIKEYINPPKKNKKVFAVRIKLNSNNTKSKLIITCLQQTITPNLNLITDKGDHMVVVEYSDDELNKYGFKLAHIKKIIKALEKRTISLEKNVISISEILE